MEKEGEPMDFFENPVPSPMNGKKKFLQRKSKKTEIPPTTQATKTYSYYGENKSKKKNKSETSKEGVPFSNSSKAVNAEKAKPEEEKPKANMSEKKFLKRGGGLGGGKGIEKNVVDKPNPESEIQDRQYSSGKKIDRDLKEDSESDSDDNIPGFGKRRSLSPLKNDNEQPEHDLKSKMPAKARHLVEDGVEKEIQKFKSDNQELKLKTISFESQLSRVRLDNHEIHDVIQKEMKDFEEMKQGEMRKLKKEKKEFEKDFKSRKLERESKRENNEICDLQSEVRRLRDVLKSKESDLTVLDDLKEELDDLNLENSDLQKSIRDLER